MTKEVSDNQQKFCESVYQFVKEQAGDQNLDGVYSLVTIFEIKDNTLTLKHVGCEKPKYPDEEKPVIITE